MIQHGDLVQVSDLLDLPGEVDVVAAGFERPSGVVVRKDDATGEALQGNGEDDAGVSHRTGESRLWYADSIPRRCSACLGRSR